MGSQETLVGRIRHIEGINEFIEVNKEKEMKEQFESWRGYNTIVNKVMQGKTTFLNEYNQKLEEYNSLKLLIPYSLPEGFEKNISDLENCIENSGLNDRILNKLFCNPVGGGGSGLVIGAAFAKTVIKQKMGRRAFLKDFLKMASLIGGIGTGVGTLVSLTSFKQLHELEQNAIYLDDIYSKLYKNN